MSAFNSIKFSFLFLLWFMTGVLYGQPVNDNCVNSTALCPNVLTVSTNASATAQCGGADADCSSTGTWGNCYDVNNSVWFSFITNSSGGNVNVSVSGISCLNQSGTNLLQGVLLQASTACDPATYTTIDCNSGSASGFFLAGSGLAPNTRYWIQIDGSGSVSNAECVFNIEVSGNAVSWQYNLIVTDVSCNGQSDGSASITAQSGVSPYSYEWNSGQSGSSATGLAAGNYFVTITDAAFCDTVVTVTVNEPVAVNVQAFSNNSSCGNSDGSALVMPNTGFNYLWSNGQTSSQVTGLAAGVYSVTLTDASGCTATGAAMVNDDSGPSVVTSTSPVACYGGADGSATAGVSGGTSPYSYQWSPSSQTTQTANGLSAGSYIVEVTDNSGCKTSKNVTISEPSEISLALSKTDEQCESSNGTASVTASGGTGSISFVWSNGQSGGTATGLSSGQYSVTATDNNSCTQTGSVFIENQDDLNIAVGSSPVSCNAGNDGAATAEPYSGTSPYTYMWNNGQNGKTASGLQAGTYSVTVTDALGCTSSSSVNVTEPVAVVLGITTNNANCGSADGDATATVVSGGTSPFSFQWSNGQSGSSVSGLVAGSYTVTVTDNTGCTQSGTASVSENGAPAVIPGKVDVTCFGANDGSASAAASGGTSPYTYLWSNAASGSIINNLGPGTYTVSVTDASGSGCMAIASVNITEPPAFNVNSFAANPGCGLSNGSASVNVTGSNGGYAYSWSNGQNTESATGLSAGVYTVTITSGSCSTTTSVTLTEPQFSSTVNISQTETGCGASTGSAAVTASGDSPFSYAWSNGQTSAFANNLSEGNYTVTVTDKNSCTSTYTVDIAEAAAITDVQVTIHDASCGLPEGAAEVTSVTGGQTPYSYLWNTGKTTASVTGLIAGTYGLTISDANSCDTSLIVTINEKPGIRGAFLTVKDADCNIDNGSIIVDSVTGGTAPFEYSIGGGFQSGNSFTGLAAGSYIIQIQDSGNCPAYDTSAVIVQPQAPVAEFTGSDAGCSGGEGVVTAAVISGGTPPYSYSINGGTANASGTFSGLSPGNYIVKIVDSENCETEGTAQITEKECELPPIKGIPQAFSPNGDGINDTWNIANLSLYENSRIYIYDRWGQRVFLSEGYDTPWDGTSLGYPVPAATYYYVIYLDKDDDEAEIYKGAVGIVR